MFFTIVSALLSVYTIPYLPSTWQRGMTEKRVIKSVRDAYFNVPFYRQKYDAAGIDINRIRSLEDMKLLPVLTKEDVRKHYPGDMVRRGTNLKKCYHSNTSGSSGRMLSFIISPSGYAYYLAESARIYSMIGYYPWYRSCYIRLAPMNLPKASSSRQTHILSLQPVSGQIEQLKKARPDLIDASATLLLNIARHISKDDLKYIKPRCITVNSEMSTEVEREYISKVFNCPVYDEYGSEEVWSIATQCRKQQYHISSDSIWMEFLDGQGQDVKAGEVGDILITTTRSEAMPFIRYAIGDRGRPDVGVCDCGYKSPLLKSIDGRFDDWLVLPSGKLFEPSVVVATCNKTILKNPLLFDQFELIQKTRELLILRYVQGQNFDISGLDTILKDLKEIIGEPINVLSEEGQPESGGKRKTLKSLVPHDCL